MKTLPYEVLRLYLNESFIFYVNDIEGEPFEVELESNKEYIIIMYSYNDYGIICDIDSEIQEYIVDLNNKEYNYIVNNFRNITIENILK